VFVVAATTPTNAMMMSSSPPPNNPTTSRPPFLPPHDPAQLIKDFPTTHVFIFTPNDYDLFPVDEVEAHLFDSNTPPPGADPRLLRRWRGYKREPPSEKWLHWQSLKKKPGADRSLYKKMHRQHSRANKPERLSKYQLATLTPQQLLISSQQKQVCFFFSFFLLFY
jgi:hypothetical protein